MAEPVLPACHQIRVSHLRHPDLCHPRGHLRCLILTSSR